MSPETVREAWERQDCKSDLQDCDGTRVILSQYLDEEFWTYFFDGEDDSYDQMVISYIGDHYEILEGFGPLNRFNGEAYIGRLFVDENGFLNLNAKILIPKTELTASILSAYMTAWQMDFEMMVRLIRQGKGN